MKLIYKTVLTICPQILKHKILIKSFSCLILIKIIIKFRNLYKSKKKVMRQKVTCISSQSKFRFTKNLDQKQMKVRNLLEYKI